MTSQVMKFCHTCNKYTLHVRPSTSHVLHFLLSIITVGVWVPIWLLVTLSNNTQGQCTVCGAFKGVLGTGRAGNLPTRGK